MSTKDTPQSTRELLIRMLESQTAIRREESRFTPDETIHLDLLVKGGGGGPAPLSKVESLTLHDEFVSVQTAEGTTLLPYVVVIGVRFAPREKARGAGFHR